MTTPRLGPLPLGEWSDTIPTKGLLTAGEAPLNIFGTLAHHPGMLKRWLVFATHVLSKSTLSARDREVLILRTAALTRSSYEWSQHVAIALDAGMQRDEIAAVAQGQAPTSSDAVLIAAAEELHETSTIGDATWASLCERYGTEQLIDVVTTVGQYHLVAFLLNALGVELDAEVPDEGAMFA
jgi:alkylhydroperoxidase family enzyme